MNRDKQIKSSNWLTEGYSQKELEKIKAEAIKEAEIEEMAKIMCVSDKDCFMCPVQSPCHLKNFAKRLYEKGYRKADELAEELINMALSKVQIMISAIKSQEENGSITEFNGGAKTALEIVFKDLAELKKKYAEGEG